jgi:YD repeat-containing protein
VRAASAPATGFAAGTVELVGEDLALASPGQGLEITRAFTSGGIIVSPLGPGWDLAWRWRLRENLDGSVDLFDGNGRRFAFALANGAYIVPDDLFVRLVRTDTGFELRLTNGELAVFDRAGLLVELRDRFRNTTRNGSALRFAYTRGGVPVRVTAVGASTAEDRFVAFALDRDGRITGAEDGTGRSVSYDYDPAGRLVAAAGVNLTCGVTQPGRPTWQYAYAEASPPAADGLLTGAGVARLARAIDVADPEGRTALQADWDEAGRPKLVRRGELVWDVHSVTRPRRRSPTAPACAPRCAGTTRGRLARLTEAEARASSRSRASSATPLGYRPR